LNFDIGFESGGTAAAQRRIAVTQRRIAATR
jgi:hypothetical protein